jgi:hypothetical protein
MTLWTKVVLQVLNQIFSSFFFFVRNAACVITGDPYRNGFYFNYWNTLTASYSRDVGRFDDCETSRR